MGPALVREQSGTSSCLEELSITSWSCSDKTNAKHSRSRQWRYHSVVVMIQLHLTSCRIATLRCESVSKLRLKRYAEDTYLCKALLAKIATQSQAARVVQLAAERKR